MRRISLLLAALFAALAVPAHARTITVHEEWVEQGSGSDRFISGVPLEAIDGIATYGPFRVIDAAHAALVGITDEHSPGQFAAMLRDYPGLARIDLVECPGTFDDASNLRVGRMIRAAGLETHVPKGGSVRSGAVELFIAGARRSIDDGARFAVHAWMDDSGFEATDYSASAPENSKYLSYYREMGMATDKAEAFYAMTNSVPHEQALWLSPADMRGWVSTQGPAAQSPKQSPPRLAYLDLGLTLN